MNSKRLENIQLLSDSLREAGKSDYAIMHFLAKFADSSMLRRDRHLEDRLRLHRRVAQCRMDNGMMWVQESGRDCDHFYAVLRPRMIRATVESYDALWWGIYGNAEGPFNIAILTPEEAAEAKEYSRDYALEAYEDGHPWSVAM